MIFCYRFLQNIEYSSLCYTVGVTYFKHNTACVSVNPKLLIYPPHLVIPFGNNKFVLHVCGSNSVLYICSFALFLFFRFHIKGISCDVCLSRSDFTSFL